MDELVQESRSLVHQFLSRFIDDADEAEDLTQDVLMKVVEQIHKLRNPDSFERWLLGIARNYCKMWLRSKAVARKREFVCVQDYFGADLPDDPRLWQLWEKRQIVEGWLSSLPPRWAKIMRLHYLNGYTEREIAQQLGVPITTVVNDVHRAKQKLKEAIGMPKQKLHEITRTVQKELEIKDCLPFVLYGGQPGWQWQIQGSNDEFVRMEVTVKSWGWTEKDAKNLQKQIAIQLHQINKLSFSEPFEHFPFYGQAWSGVSFPKRGKPQPIHAPHEGLWQEVMKWWQIFDATSKQEAQGQIGIGALLAVVADDGLRGLEIPEKQMPENFPVTCGGYLKGGERMVFGLGVVTRIRLSIPNGLPLLLFPLNSDVIVTGFKDSITVVGGWGKVTLHKVKGTVRVLGDATLLEVDGLEGDLNWHMVAYMGGGNWSEGSVHRPFVPTTQVKNVTGNLKIAVKQVQIILKNVRGNMHVENEFGKTECWLTERVEGAHYELRSISGNITVFLSPKVDRKLKIHIFTECGAIHYAQWRKEARKFPLPLSSYSIPKGIFIGTAPERETPDLLIVNRAGKITVAYS